MLQRLLRSEWKKLKGKGLWLLTLLGPAGVIGLTMVNYGLRKDFLLSVSDDDWQYYLDNILSFTSMALVLGVVIITSLLASIENQTNAWKQWLTLPVSRVTVYLSKYIVATVLLFVSSLLLALGTLGYGLTLGLGEDIPWVSILLYSFYPWLSAQAIIALHLWVASVSNNQGVTVSLGVIGVVLNIMSYNLPDWVIWKWPMLLNQWDNTHLNPLLGIGSGILLFCLGSLHFNRRDVI